MQRCSASDVEASAIASDIHVVDRASYVYPDIDMDGDDVSVDCEEEAALLGSCEEKASQVAVEVDVYFEDGKESAEHEGDDAGECMGAEEYLESMSVASKSTSVSNSTNSKGDKIKVKAKKGKGDKEKDNTDKKKEKEKKNKEKKSYCRKECCLFWCCAIFVGLLAVGMPVSLWILHASWTTVGFVPVRDNDGDRTVDVVLTGVNDWNGVKMVVTHEKLLNKNLRKNTVEGEDGEDGEDGEELKAGEAYKGRMRIVVFEKMCGAAYLNEMVKIKNDRTGEEK